MTIQDAISAGLARQEWPSPGPWPVDVIVYAVHPDVGEQHVMLNLPAFRDAWPSNRDKGYWLVAFDGTGHLSNALWDVTTSNG